MKLCIIKPDGSNAEVLLGYNQPSLENVNNDLLLFENYPYKLILRSEEIFDNIELFVGDYEISLKINPSTGCYETEKGTVFGGCFDLVCVSINIENGDGEEITSYSDYMRIATTKQTAKQVELMLGEIENNLPNFLEVCFSHSRKRAGLIKNDIRSIWNTLRVIDEIVSVYEENYGYFSNHKKSIVEQDVVQHIIAVFIQHFNYCLLLYGMKQLSLCFLSVRQIISVESRLFYTAKQAGFPAYKF